MVEWSSKDKKTGVVSTSSFLLRDREGNAGKATVGEVRLRDFNAADISADKSQLQVFDAGVDHFVYNSAANIVYGDGVKLEAAYVKGGGDGKVSAGYKGFGLDNLQVFGDEKNGVLSETARVKGLKSDGGYAIMNGFKEGQEFKVAYANVKSLTADSIDAKFKIPPTSYEDAKKDYAAKKAAFDARGPYDPSKHGYDMSGLGQMQGRVDGSYTYNKAQPGFWESVGAGITGRDAGFGVDIEGGNVDLSSLHTKTDWLSVGGFVGNVLGTPAELGFRGAAGADHLINGGTAGSWTPTYLANKYGGGDAESYNKAPEEPKESDYTTEGAREKRDALTRTNLDVNLTNVGGGNIGVGTDFRGKMDKGAALQAKGNLGSQFDVHAQNLGFTNVSAMDGQVTVGKAGTSTVDVTITDAGDPQRTRVDLKVKGTVIKDVKYGGKDVNTQAADAENTALTTR